MEYLKAFLIGGALCLIGQLLIDKTGLTPARILVCYVVAGVILGGVGLYGPFAEFAGAGATVPLTGFGNLLAKGVKEAVDEKGFHRGTEGHCRWNHRRHCRGTAGKSFIPCQG